MLILFVTAIIALAADKDDVFHHFPYYLYIFLGTGIFSMVMSFVYEMSFRDLEQPER